MGEVNAVFEGGGIRGIALAGAAAGAMDLGIRFADVAGTSAGAMVASLVAAGYGPEELAETVCRIRWPELLDSLPLRGVPFVGTHLALVLWKGLYRGDRLEETWTELLAAKGVRTFADLPPGRLRALATDLTHRKGLVLPDGLSQYGLEPNEFPVARAVRISASLPFVFRSVVVDNCPAGGERVLLSDGAMASVFPVGLVAGPRPILGFRLVSQDLGHPHTPIRGPASLAAAVVASGIRARESLPGYTTAPAHVIEVPADRDPIDFSLSPDEARAMFNTGRAAARRYLSDRRLGLGS